MYNRCLCKVLFREDSYPADHLLALSGHPEEEVQVPACRGIQSPQCGTAEVDTTTKAPRAPRSFDTAFRSFFFGDKHFLGDVSNQSSRSGK